MPIRIPDALPATEVLESENIFVMTEHRAIHQDIRPLRVLILNLMPLKIETETQILRKLSNTPLQVEVDLLQTVTHKATHVPPKHMESFYVDLDDIRNKRYDGMIVTGAPVEKLPFEDVDYWPELCDIFEWAKTNVFSTLYLCWGAQAGLYYHYGIQKKALPEKLFGVYPHHADYKRAILLRGFDDEFWIPHSRHTTVERADIEAVPGLKILASSPDAGVYAAMNKEGRQIFVIGHAEYDADTLEKEYLRDKAQGLPIHVPANYYPNDDDTQRPVVRWRGHAHLLFSNWLNYFVYQTTPYDIMAVGVESTRE